MRDPRDGSDAPGPAGHVPRFLAWLGAFGEALETGDLASLDSLFAVGATYRPGPFQPPLRGRRAIRQHLDASLAGRRNVVIRAKALGVGATYAVAHWVEAWSDAEGDRLGDGIILAAFDARGRCTSLRLWSEVGERGAGPSDPDAPGS
jgi:hypothetical protein